MRGEIRSRPFTRRCWVHFDLACVQRVRDLLGPGLLRWVDEYAGWAARDFMGGRPAEFPQQIARADLTALLGVRRDPLRSAKLAAARAVLALGAGTLATSEMVCIAAGRRALSGNRLEAAGAERRTHADLMRCVFRSTLSAVILPPAWRTDTVVAIAEQMRRLRDYSAVPILADALQEVGCEDECILSHCRCAAPHVQGCWVVDLVLARK
jgi:hypothetical protein